MPADDGRVSILVPATERPPAPPSGGFEQSVSRLLTAARRTKMPERDAALVYVLLGTGLYPLEIARLRVSDYLTPSGAVKQVSALRRDVAVKGYERPLLWTNERLQAAVDEYLAFRVRRGHLLGTGDRYRGLRPKSPLFLTNSGAPLLVSDGRGGESCTGLLSLIRKLTLDANVAFTARKARGAFARRMYDLGGDDEQIRQLIGVKKRCEFYRLIGLDPATVDPASRLGPLMRAVV